MGWNYGVMQRNGSVTVYETYYDESGRVEGRSDAVSPEAGDVDELRTTLELMLEALAKPVIDQECRS